MREPLASGRLWWIAGGVEETDRGIFLTFSEMGEAGLGSVESTEKGTHKDCSEGTPEGHL